MTMLVILRPGYSMLEGRLDTAVENTSKQLWTMLRRYLKTLLSTQIEWTTAWQAYITA